MDTYENTGFPEQDQTVVEPVEEQVERIAEPEAEPAELIAEDSEVMAEPVEAQQPAEEVNPYECELPDVSELPEPRKKKEHKWIKRIVAAILIVALVAGSCTATALILNRYWVRSMNDNNALIRYEFLTLHNTIKDLQQQIQDHSFTGNGNSISGTPNTNPDGGLTPGQVYAQNAKAVVAISNQATTNIYGQETETASSGSGFIITQDGYVVTNYHVVEGASKLTVILHDGTEYTAKLVGYDSGNDMAVLKIGGTDLPCVKLGSSKDLIVGDQVVAIGNPLGQLTNSLTVGYVSALERDIHSGGARINMIQTDVAINSGNSGGPLFNMKGEVVGITTAKYSGTSNSGATIEGISFAVPFDDVKKKVMDLVEYGYLRGAYLGITVTDNQAGQGALVRAVDAGYCAAKGGLQAGDLILSLGGYVVNSMNDLGKALEHFSAGDTIQIKVQRGNQLYLLTVTLDERPKTTNTDAPTTPTEPAATQPETTNPVPQNGTAEDWWNFFFG